jgi:hypothetical protein
MNYFDYENRAEYNRKQIQTDIQLIRLEQQTRKSRVYKPGRFEHLMFNFANWMISTGKQLRKRYEIPTTNCSHTSSKRFAH